MRELRASDFTSMPWKNGGGMTLELFNLEGKLRLSVAKVEKDGPFSKFEGFTRHLLILEGGPLRVHHADHESLLKPLEIISFEGEERLASTLTKDPVTDFNVMVHREFGSAVVTLISEKEVLKAGAWSFFYQHGPEQKLWEAKGGEKLDLNFSHYPVVRVDLTLK